MMNDVYEIPDTLLNSVSNYLLPEISNAAERGDWFLVFSAIHSVMQTIGEQIFGRSGVDATTFYLENFVDRDPEDLRFSKVADQIHEIRNISAHRWFGRAMHFHVLDATQTAGWQLSGDILHLNPRLYSDSFFLGFKGPIWSWESLASTEELFRRKYRFIIRFIAVDSKDPITTEVKSLLALGPSPERDQLEETVRDAISQRFL